MVNYCQVEPAPILWADDNWTHMPTSEDQKRIEAVLPRYVLPNASWLHIGIGNSSLAKLFCPSINKLDGITVVQEEIDSAPHFDNYFIRLCNKHALEFQSFEQYDVIIDTTPAGHACCNVHLMDYFEYAFSMLAPEGAYLTDRIGLAWARPSSKGMTPEEFGEAIALFNMNYQFITDFVIEVKHARENQESKG